MFKEKVRMEYRKEDNQIIVRLARGDLVIESLTQLAKEQDLRGGFFVGLGAVDQVELAHYSVEDQQYETKKFSQPFEVTNLTGSLAWFNEDPVVHCHITVADQTMKSFGGHLVEARVSGTLEILLTQTQPLVKQVDASTGLKIFDLHQ